MDSNNGFVLAGESTVLRRRTKKREKDCSPWKEKKKMETKEESILLFCSIAMQGSELDRELGWIGVESHWNWEPILCCWPALKCCSGLLPGSPSPFRSVVFPLSTSTGFYWISLKIGFTFDNKVRLPILSFTGHSCASIEANQIIALTAVL